MHLILIQHDRQDDAMDAIALLAQHGYTAAFPTAGACEPAGLLDMAGRLVDEVATAVSGTRAASHLVTAGIYAACAMKELPDCHACHDRGWHRMATNGDTSREWIERCDECARFPDDNAAAQQASLDTGQPIAWGWPDITPHPQPHLVTADHAAYQQCVADNHADCHPDRCPDSYERYHTNSPAR